MFSESGNLSSHKKSHMLEIGKKTGTTCAKFNEMISSTFASYYNNQLKNMEQNYMNWPNIYYELCYNQVPNTIMATNTASQFIQILPYTVVNGNFPITTSALVL